LIGSNLSELAQDPPEKVMRLLQLSSRTRELVPGALVLKHGNGTVLPCRTEGALLEMTPNGSVLLFRIFSKDRATQRFRELNERIEALHQEILNRKRAEARLAASEARWRFMAESMPHKIFTTNAAGQVDYINSRWHEFTGFTPEQMRDFGWTQFIHPDDLEENIRLWLHSKATGQPFEYQHRFRRADGVYRWHLTRVQAHPGPDGKTFVWIGSSTEIHDQKETEDELRRANEDLKQFAFAASHDLQEPIRNVAVYSELVAARYHGQLDDEGRQYLAFLQEGAQRLARLVHDLLDYTRASMAELTGTPADASVALENAVVALAEAIRESGAQVTSDPLPQVFMGEAHLQQVFQNLIGNALKYRSEVPPRIHVSAVERGMMWRFSVEDNGIGIDAQFKEKIFGVFKRLHTGKYSGNGIGLAICQRVVERYGGRIWVESIPGKGSTFFFTVPQHGRPIHTAALESASS
jgi:PAS domain S-box-containing protein